MRVMKIITLVSLVFIAACSDEDRRKKPNSSCKYITGLMKDEKKRDEIENWLAHVYDNHEKWRKVVGKSFRGMGEFQIHIDDIEYVQRIGLPAHTQLLVIRNDDGSAYMVTAAVAQFIGIQFSRVPGVVDDSKISKKWSENLMTLCTRPN